MLFTSPVFLFLFLPLLILIYFLSPKQFKNLILLLSSFFFYAWGEGSYILVLIGLVIFNYLIALTSRLNKKVILVGILGDVLALAYFKYLVFGIGLLIRFAHLSFAVSSVHMPLGISFVTFHLISYLMDVYRSKIKAEKNLFNFSLYIFLFPHLIAGPIVRYVNIGPQIKNRHVSSELVAEGIRRFIVGLGKKVILANTLAQLVDRILIIFPQFLSSQVLWLALVAYALQIYFDFSGYSDMAIGLAKIFGFKFNENFNYPYLATSIQDFWHRWHMTLFAWFRDYVYIPFGGNRISLFRTCLNILIVFSLTGLWHGAAFNFIFWGFYYGVFLVLERLFLGKLLEKLWWPLRHCYALLVIVVGWLFFRVENLSYSFFLLKILFGIQKTTTSVYSVQTFLNLENSLILVISIVLSVPVFPKLLSRYSLDFKGVSLVRLTGLSLVLIYSIMQIASNTYNPFIYFRF